MREVDIKPEPKVHCKNCNFLWYNMFDASIVSCKAYVIENKESVVYGKTPEKVMLPEQHPTIRNIDFHCKYFAPRKWWRVF